MKTLSVDNYFSTIVGCGSATLQKMDSNKEILPLIFQKFFRAAIL